MVMKKPMFARFIFLIIMISAVFLLIFPSVNASVTLKVTAFSCSPNEVQINNPFSCTATVENTGTETGQLNTATLYPDASDWMESTSYAQTVNAEIKSGASAEVTFNNLKGKKSGDNGFSKIMLGLVPDTYVADYAVTVNVIDVVVTSSGSASSATSGSTVDVTAQSTAGGNIDVAMSFSVSGTGCTIGSQSSSASKNDMSNGQTFSHTWTITVGTASCSYYLSSSATSNPSGTASKSDSTSGSITCSDCTTPTSTSSSSSGSGTSGGVSSGIALNLTECSDSIDNDGDGLIDLDDPGCESAEDDDEKDPLICTQEWVCGEWSSCKDSKQTRICVDDNDCLGQKDEFDKIIEIERPAETQNCKEELGVVEKGKEALKNLVIGRPVWQLIVGVVVIIAIIAAGVYAYLRKDLLKEVLMGKVAAKGKVNKRKYQKKI